MNSPKNAKEALIAELLGEIDDIIKRVDTADKQLKITTDTLKSATEEYKSAVIAFNEQAKSDLIQFLDIKSSEAASKLLNVESESKLKQVIIEAVNSAKTESKEINNIRKELKRINFLAFLFLTIVQLTVLFLYFHMPCPT